MPAETASSSAKPSAAPTRSATLRRATTRTLTATSPRNSSHDDQRRAHWSAWVGKQRRVVGRLGPRAGGIGRIIASQAQREKEVQEQKGQGRRQAEQTLSKRHGTPRRAGAGGARQL